MRSSQPDPAPIDLPIDVQLAEIDSGIDTYQTYQPIPVARPVAIVGQEEKALSMLRQAPYPLIVARGGIGNIDACDPLIVFAELTGARAAGPTLMGWSTISDDHSTSSTDAKRSCR